MIECKSGFPYTYSTQCPCGHKYLSWSFVMRKKPTLGTATGSIPSQSVLDREL